MQNGDEKVALVKMFNWASWAPLDEEVRWVGQAKRRVNLKQHPCWIKLYSKACI